MATDTDTRRDRWGFMLEVLTLALALAGFGINLLLLIRHLTGGGLAGCGGDTPCDHLLDSRWSQIFGIPVGALALLVYLGLMASVVAKSWRWVCVGLGVLVGAALWFLWVQVVLIGQVCSWCMTAHGVGVLMAIIGARRVSFNLGSRLTLRVMGYSAAGALLAIALLQVIGPTPVTHRITSFPDGGAVPNVPSIHARGTGRKVSFVGGRKRFDVTAMPRLGNPEAKRVMIEYFDYQCAACRTMGGT